MQDESAEEQESVVAQRSVEQMAYHLSRRTVSEAANDSIDGSDEPQSPTPYDSDYHYFWILIDGHRVLCK